MVLSLSFSLSVYIYIYICVYICYIYIYIYTHEPIPTPGFTPPGYSVFSCMRLCFLSAFGKPGENLSISLFYSFYSFSNSILSFRAILCGLFYPGYSSIRAILFFQPGESLKSVLYIYIYICISK